MPHDAAGEGDLLCRVDQQGPGLRDAGGYIGYTAATVAACTVPGPSVVHGIALNEGLTVVVIVVVMVLIRVLFACH